MEELQQNQSRATHDNVTPNMMAQTGTSQVPDTPAHASVLKEDYKGPSATVTAVGVGAIETKVMWLVGLLTGGAVGAAIPDPINKLAEKSKAIAEAKHASEPGLANALKRGSSKTISGIFKASNWLVSHLPGHEKMQAKNASNKRFTAAVAAGGLFSLAAVVGSTIHGALVGVQSAREGKDQFTRAQKEIKNLLTENEALNNELNETTKELAKINVKNRKEAILKKAEADEVAKPTSTISKPVMSQPLQADAPLHDNER